MSGERHTARALDGTELGIYVARPSTPPRAGLIVIQEVFGVNAHIRDVTERFAREGWLCAAPDLFHRSEPWFQGSYDEFGVAMQRANATTQPHIRADLRATHLWLANELGADARIGAVGFCMGGRQAYVANGTLPLACAVSFYGSNIPALRDLATSQSGPIMLIWGGLDAHIDIAQRREVVDLLREAKKSYVDVTFSEVDHAFFNDSRKKQYNAEAAAEAWTLATTFLHRRLGTQPEPPAR